MIRFLPSIRFVSILAQAIVTSLRDQELRHHLVGIIKSDNDRSQHIWRMCS